MEETLEDKLLYELSQKNVKCCICTSCLGNEDNFMKVKDLSGKEVTGSDEIDSDVKHIFQAICPTCGGVSFWEIESAFHYNGDGGIEDIKTDSIKLIYPLKPNYGDIPEPNENMPDDIKVLYEMATIAYYNIPQSCGTLLRLGLEKILDYMADNGFKGLKNKKNGLKDKINNLKSIMRNKQNTSLNENDIDIIKSMDLIRLKGNYSTHELIDKGTKISFLPLFQYLNFLAEEIISRPKLSKEIEKDYDLLDEIDKVIKQK